MSTNFYWKLPVPKTYTLPTGQEIEIPVDHMDPRIHIGKRSGAGEFCRNCSVTLCKDGEDAIHYGKSEWYSSCPVCHTDNDVTIVCSFTWAQDAGKIILVCKEKWNEEIIEDDNGSIYTGREFLNALNHCPIGYHDYIGKWFC